MWLHFCSVPKHSEYTDQNEIRPGLRLFYFYLFCCCCFVTFITKTCLYDFDPLKPHFYIVKLGFTGVYIIFLISAHKDRLWVLVRTASIYVLNRKLKNIRVCLSEKFQSVQEVHAFVVRETDTPPREMTLT